MVGRLREHNNITPIIVVIFYVYRYVYYVQLHDPYYYYPFRMTEIRGFRIKKNVILFVIDNVVKRFKPKSKPLWSI